jgi:hypothetical protein
MHVWMMLMLGAGGLFAGGATFVAVERVWVWRQLSLVDYSIDFRRSLHRVDPMQPILCVLAAGSAAGFGLTANGLAARFALVSAALFTAVIVSSLLFAEPINSRFRRRPLGEVPDGAERLPVTWRRFHLARTAVAVVAFACAVAAVAVAR